MGRILVGTSGWNYREWRGPFYPEDLSRRRWLEHYAGRLPSVELNATFYGLPERDSVRSWAEQVPEGFVFAVKASRYLTHLKHLKDPEDPLRRLLERTEPLGSKHGPLLAQLPGSWRPDPGRLDGFLRSCPPELEVAVEFRDPRWYIPEVREVLELRQAASVWHDFPGMDCPRWETAPFLYVRRHGNQKEPYRGRYGREGLAQLAKRLRGWEGRAYCYFNNDVDAHAPADAALLLEMVGG